MNWSQRINKLVNVGFLFTNRNEEKRKEYHRSGCRYQSYVASSNLAHIQIKAKPADIRCDDALKYYRTNLMFLPKQNAQMLNQYHITANLDNDSAVKEKKNLEKDTVPVDENNFGAQVDERFFGAQVDAARAGAKVLYNLGSIMNILARDVLRLMETQGIQMFQYDFVVNKPDLQAKDKLQLDASLCFSTGGVKYEGYSIYLRHIIPFTLDTLMTTDELLFTDCIHRIMENYKFSLTTNINMTTDVRFRNVEQLCDKEKAFVLKRKTVVFEKIRDKFGLQKLLQLEEDAPNIAVIGSGGGMRAVIGMCGAMTALQENGILDCTMYSAGLSGSAWYLMALYANDKQHNPKEVTDIIRKKLKNVRTKELFWTKWWKSWTKWWKSWTFQLGQDSFPNSYELGHMIGDMLIEKDHIDDSWCKQTSKLEDGCVPLPLVAALHVCSENTKVYSHEWVEFSPYEAFIPKYGAGIDMRNFWDKFYGGFVLTENRSSVIHLLGLCGSGFTNVREAKPQESYWYMSLSGIKNRIDYMLHVYETIFDTIFVEKVPNWLHGIQLNPLFDDLDSNTARIDTETEEMILTDAGFAFTSPYPTVLHPSRKVDVILSFDFSEREEDTSWPFEELIKAEQWARKKRVPFPNLKPKLKKIKKDWAKGIYEEVYVFKGDNAPTILHFVLINKSDTTRNNFKIFPDYRTQRFKYSEREFDQLKSLVEGNVRKNNKKIEESICKEVVRKLENSIKT